MTLHKKQFDLLKKKHTDMLLIMKILDTGISFGSDAEEIAKILGETLTQKDGISFVSFKLNYLKITKILREGKSLKIAKDLNAANNFEKEVVVAIKKKEGDYFVSKLDSEPNNFWKKEIEVQGIKVYYRMFSPQFKGDEVSFGYYIPEE